MIKSQELNMKQDKLVSVITINYGHSKETIDCINSVLSSTYENFVVILIDNGSEHEDYKKLQDGVSDERVKIVRQEPNIGYVGGINLGIIESGKYDPDFYLIMNNDTLIDKKAIEELLITAVKYDNGAIVTGKVYNMDKKDTLQYVGQWCRNSKNLDFPPYIKGGRELDNGQYDNEMELGMADDIFWLIPKKIFQVVGFYSTDFFLYGEQNDYALRVKRNGFKLIYTPKAKIWHYHHLTTAGGDLKSLKVYYWQSYADLLLFIKYLSFFRFILRYFKRLLRDLVKILIFKINKSKAHERSFRLAKIRLLALWYFTKWVFHRKQNTGFNPVE